MSALQMHAFARLDKCRSAPSHARCTPPRIRQDEIPRHRRLRPKFCCAVAENTVVGVLRNMTRIVHRERIRAAYPQREELVVVEAGRHDQRSWFLVAGMTLHWRWNLKQLACDVCFSVRAKRCGKTAQLVVVQAPGKFRNGQILRGQWTCPEDHLDDPWMLQLAFDNRHSIFRSKKVLLWTRVATIPDKEVQIKDTSTDNAPTPMPTPRPPW